MESFLAPVIAGAITTLGSHRRAYQVDAEETFYAVSIVDTSATFHHI